MTIILLWLQYHPDVSKDSHASELFKSIRHAYEVLSDETTRIQYDRELQSSHKPYQEKWSYSTEFEDDVRSYRWAYMRKKMRSERYREYYNINEDYYSSETDEKEEEENLNEERDAGYKVGYVIAWILGGRGGVILTLFLSFASWVFGKTSSSVVALFMVAMWVGSSLSSYAPLPQGALLTLIYMSIKLQSDQI
ncbi:chaperone protein dnaJ [Trifolium pratense]|uniref:Chaperone protein dnaJ n=1 Tax=Trifolium pratense TaxID=57577 RepID=A0A2K3MQ27_TRIPR|nr:chaperone protein dnaJ [Trifolium pratense]